MKPYTWSLALIVCLQFTLALWAGDPIRTGNTEIHTKSGSFTFASQHPFETELLKILDDPSIDLPVLFRDAIKRDLKATSIIISQVERFTKSDFEAGLSFTTIRKRVKTIRQNGQATKIVSEKIQELDRSSRHSEVVYLYNLDLKLPNYDKAPLLGISFPDEKLVLYFAKPLKALTPRRQIEHVIHEMVHRNFGNYFADIAHYERVAKAFAYTFTSYLYGEISKDNFYAVLAKRGVKLLSRFDYGQICESINCYDNEISMGQSIYRRRFRLKLKRRDIIKFGNTHTTAEGHRFSYFLNAEIFHNEIPLGSDQKLIKVFRSSDDSNYGSATAMDSTSLQWLQKVLANSAPNKALELSFYVYYEKTLDPMDGEVRTSYRLRSVFFDEDLAFYPELRRRLNAHFRGGLRVLNSPLLNYLPEYEVRARKFYTHMADWLDQLKAERPHIYYNYHLGEISKLNPNDSPLKLRLSLTSTHKFDADELGHSSSRLKMVRPISYDMTLESMSGQLEYVFNEAAHYEVSNFNDYHKSLLRGELAKEFIQSLHGSIEQHAVLLHLMIARDQLVKAGLGELNISLKKSEHPRRLKIVYFEGGYDLIISIPQGLLNSNPQEILSIINEYIFNPNKFSYGRWGTTDYVSEIELKDEDRGIDIESTSRRDIGDDFEAKESKLLELLGNIFAEKNGQGFGGVL